MAAPAVVEADSDAEAAAGVAAAASEEVAAEASAVDEAVAAEASAEDAAAEEEATVGAAGEVEATVVDAEVEEVIDVLLSALMRLLLFFGEHPCRSFPMLTSFSSRCSWIVSNGVVQSKVDWIRVNTTNKSFGTCN